MGPLFLIAIKIRVGEGDGSEGRGHLAFLPHCGDIFSEFSLVKTSLGNDPNYVLKEGGNV